MTERIWVLIIACILDVFATVLWEIDGYESLVVGFIVYIVVVTYLELGRNKRKGV